MTRWCSATGCWLPRRHRRNEDGRPFNEEDEWLLRHLPRVPRRGRDRPERQRGRAAARHRGLRGRTHALGARVARRDAPAARRAARAAVAPPQRRPERIGGALDAALEQITSAIGDLRSLITELARQRWTSSGWSRQSRPWSRASSSRPTSRSSSSSTSRTRGPASPARSRRPCTGSSRRRSRTSPSTQGRPGCTRGERRRWPGPDLDHDDGHGSSRARLLLASVCSGCASGSRWSWHAHPGSRRRRDSCGR